MNFFVFVLCLVAVAGMAGVLKPLAEGLGRRIAPPRGARPDPADAARLAALEERVALLAEEVERGREEQRFLTDLLTERASLPSDRGG